MQETFTAEQFFAELEALGEESVRLNLIAKKYGSGNHKKELAEEWLRLLEDQRREDREAASERRAERMISTARLANIIAVIAAITAIIAAITAT